VRLVALMPARNEDWILDFSLSCLEGFVDDVVVLDDGSIDATPQIVSAHGAVCIPGEAGGFALKRQILLDKGREIGGTHFLFLDADEVLTANLRGVLRDACAKAKPGQRLLLNWLAMWRSPFCYRYDSSVWTNNFKDFIYVDNQVDSFDTSVFIHEPRTPACEAMSERLSLEGGVMHYQFVPWVRLLNKQAWYRCLERVKFPEKNDEEINGTYSVAVDETGLAWRPIRASWITGYTIPAGIEDGDSSWHEREIVDLMRLHGPEKFLGLEIWHKDWLAADPDTGVVPKGLVGSQGSSGEPLSKARSRRWAWSRRGWNRRKP
jgi:glycosyltransferase involved in cell wall biosynthesis